MISGVVGLIYSYEAANLCHLSTCLNTIIVFFLVEGGESFY